MRAEVRFPAARGNAGWSGPCSVQDRSDAFMDRNGREIMKNAFSTALAVGALTTALTGGASAAQTERYQVKEEGVSAHFSSIDSRGCVVTDTFIWAGEDVTKQGPGAPVTRSQVFASFSRLNLCEWTYLTA